MKKLDLTKVAEFAEEYGYLSPENIGRQQIVVFVMLGGGMLGLSAAEQPADFSIDGRVGRLPFTRKEICQAVSVLITLAIKAGLNPHKMPPMPKFHNCGVF